MSVDGALSLFLGTWKTRYTDVSPSAPIPIPIEATAAFHRVGDFVRYTADTVYPDGRSALIEATFHADGQPYPLNGSLIGDSVIFQQTSHHTLVATVMRNGVLSGSVSAKVSTDGHTLTIRYEVFLPDGKTVTYKTVGDRQPD
ncbi:MAG: hypothetical protein WBW33_13235 [Bryobacteraceae bacterium]